MKKIVLNLLILTMIACLFCVYVVGGMPGAFVWSFVLLICAPIALVLSILQVILLVLRIYMKKKVKWNIKFLIVSLVAAYPVTIILGISDITYPTKANLKDTIYVTIPIEKSIPLGGKGYKTHAIWPSECYAYDILSEPYDTGNKELESYGVYNADVISPVSGTIIGLGNSEPDILPNTEEFISLLGNYVFIEIDDTGTYMILAHFKQGSIALSVGDRVEEGEYIGKVGNSGTTSEPHLHIQHQRNNPLEMIYPTCSEGLPIEFK